MVTQKKILVVEDNELNRAMLVEILSDSEQEPEPEISRTAAEGETYLYDAIQPLGNAVYEISVSCPDTAAMAGMLTAACAKMHRDGSDGD